MTTDPIRRYTETTFITRGCYLVTVHENRPSERSKHRVIAQRVTRTKRQAESAARILWRAFHDPRTPGEFDRLGEAALS